MSFAEIAQKQVNCFSIIADYLNPIYRGVGRLFARQDTAKFLKSLPHNYIEHAQKHDVVERENCGP